MTTRERILYAYGGMCAWCRRTDIPLQFDHIRGDGGEHRRILKGKAIEIWLDEQHTSTGFWPATIQLLCVPCHQRKTALQRIQAMPPKEGYRSLNIALPEVLIKQLEVVAKEPQYTGSKSQVIHAALTTLLEDTSNGVMHDTVRQSLSEFHMAIMQQLQGIATDYQTLIAHMTALEAHIANVEQLATHHKGIDDRRYTELLSAYDRMAGRTSSKRKSWWQRLFNT